MKNYEVFKVGRESKMNVLFDASEIKHMLNTYAQKGWKLVDCIQSSDNGWTEELIFILDKDE